MNMMLRFLTRSWAARCREAASLALVLLALLGGPALAGVRDQLTLLVPDNANLLSWEVQVWTDTAAEEGVQMRVMTDSAFLALGNGAAASVAGLILPDSAHIQASDELVAAVVRYVAAGGRLLLTFDAGALNAAGFYDPAGRSRFSDLVGVDYVLDQSLRERVVGFGPVVGTKGRLDNLSMPPGKYLPYGAAADGAAGRSIVSLPAYVPTNRFDPGGSQHLRNWLLARASGLRAALSAAAAPLLRYDSPVGTATPALAQTQATATTTAAGSLRLPNDISARVGIDGRGWTETAPSATAASLLADDATLQAISGYGFGVTDYYHFVTTGTFPGTVFLSSPAFGLVAGERSYGSGKVLFVNIPLGQFKAVGTDGALLHGFITHFARDQVDMARLSAQPRAVGGLVYNWHVDDGDDIVPDFRDLMQLDWMQKAGPFSVHFTAGPDVAELGDGLGMNLPRNPPAQDVVRRAAKVGFYAFGNWVRQEIGSHGGWNHNLYGFGANEGNAALYQPWLTLNFNAIENVTGFRLREYSAPLGNNPAWAVNWLEARGVVGMYTVSNTGSPATREWRNGARLTNRLWANPIAPFGISATFEDFEANGQTDAQSAQWLVDLQSFVVNHRTNRLFYNHPPGAVGHLGVVETFVKRGTSLAGANKFRWYSMQELADFNQRRIQTTWESTKVLGTNYITMQNPQSLVDVAMLLPRSRYERPWIMVGLSTVTYDATYWIVTVKAGSWLKMIAQER
jgi:hypothetical protein